MKRAGFTLIELIFVIVIIGILSAVAIPKFLGVADQAHLSNVKSYVATFNMTTGPALWSTSLSNNLDGSITTMDANLTEQLPTPTYISDVNVTRCTLTSPTEAIGETDSTPLTATTSFASSTIGTSTYYLGCENGSSSASPRLWLEDSTGKILVK
jgi:prepilin-type N-terminal cleavage/methylation domain-containing protein